ncbi:tRNA (adenosine(37)-N6)-threonylcarbamoyltransferase complex transferase subunit TsaD [Candidatus Daviesbacteria bacterium]|nr:tRNA (adenosine(37)-N6)-threonylcarbamoyltransferase complex transferase subunit TsaD [Candidatus Daviesbacteria bacterium]
MAKSKIILGIETSCDETAAAVLQKQGNWIQIVSNIVASSADLQAKYGGIIPEQAAREQIKSIIPVIQEVLVQSNLYPPSSKNHLLSSTIHRPAIDAIAVTQGPGLIGSLLVGVETAKTLSLVWNKPLIPINHLMGHFYASWIFPSSLRDHEVAKQTLTTAKIATSSDGHRSPHNDVFGIPKFPCIGLLVSGGHTDLILMKGHHSYIYLGGTRDDAAGECFDKCARLLGLPYPGGPQISKLASKGDAFRFKLPRPMIDSNDFDFSFSGLKTAVANLVPEQLRKTQKTRQSETPEFQNSDTQGYSELFRNNLCASIEQAIIDCLIKKTILAAQKYKVGQIIIAGGVAANQKLISDFKLRIENSKLKIDLYVPPVQLCTDNAAMIAARAFFEKPISDPLKLQANPNLSLGY